MSHEERIKELEEKLAKAEEFNKKLIELLAPVLIYMKHSDSWEEKYALYLEKKQQRELKS